MALAGGALALLLLLSTQGWVETVVQPAPGGPSVREVVPGAAGAPWGPAAALLGLAAAAVALVLPRRWPRLLTALTAVVALAAALTVTLGTPPVTAGQLVRSSTPTAWAWAGVLVAGAATCAALLALVLPAGRRRPRPDAGRTPAERARREAAEQWRRLSEGEDPTGGA